MVRRSRPRTRPTPAGCGTAATRPSCSDRETASRPATGRPVCMHREHAGAGHGEQRHRLGKAVDRVAPALLEQQQNRRNQRAGVADTDPPDEVDDGEAPADRNVDAPDADAADRTDTPRRTAADSAGRRRRRSRPSQPSVTGRRSTMRDDLVGDVSSVWPGIRTGGCPGRSRSSASSLTRWSPELVP